MVAWGHKGEPVWTAHRFSMTICHSFRRVPEWVNATPKRCAPSGEAPASEPRPVCACAAGGSAAAGDGREGSSQADAGAAGRSTHLMEEPAGLDVRAVCAREGPLSLKIVCRGAQAERTI